MSELELTPGLYHRRSLVPIPAWDQTSPRPDIDIGEGIKVKDVEGLLSESNFSLWDKYVPQRTIERLSRVKVAFVHDYAGKMGSGLAEKESKDALIHAFAALRIVRPTRAYFECIQMWYDDQRKLDVQSFTHSYYELVNVPTPEVLAVVNPNDIRETVSVFRQLRLLVQIALSETKKDPWHEALLRGINFYEKGYTESQDPTTQIILWVIGIEAIVRAKYRDDFVRQDQVRDSLVALYADRNIYEEYRDPYGVMELEPVLVSSIIGDLFQFRNDLVHGSGIQDRWLSETGRRTLQGESLRRADVLREAAPFVLRLLIKDSLAQIA